MSASSGKRGVSAKDLPEVFVLKKEVQFDAWRQVFSETCKILGVKKILKSTPAVKDRTTGFTASSVAAERNLTSIMRGEPKAPVRVKEQAPDLMAVKADEREAAMMEYYTKREKSDAAYEKDWERYLVEKRTFDNMLKKAESEVSRLRNSEPILDDDVVEIHPKVKKEGSKNYEYKATYSKTQSLDAEEEKLFGVDHEWISGETGDYESADETTARMKLWKWLEKSLEGGPCKHLAPACEIPGDVRSVYFGVKEKCTRVTVLIFGLALSDYFRKDKFLKESDPQVIYTALKMEASTIEEMGKRLKIPKTLHPEIIKSQLMVALMLSDPEKINQRAMMDMVAGNMEFTSEDLLEHLRKQHLLARELKEVSGGKGAKSSKMELSKVEALMMSKTNKPVGICYDYQSEEGCLRKDCRYRHEILPANPKKEPNDREGSGVGRCMRCAQRGHHGSECPDRKKLLCIYCGKKGHVVETCLTNPDNEKSSPTKKSGGKGESRGRGGRGGREGREKTSKVNAVQTGYDESTDESTDGSSSDDSAFEYRGTMVLQSKTKARSNTFPKSGKDEVRMLIDSGCDTLAMKERSKGYDWEPAKMMVNEATEGKTTLVGCKGKVELELPMGGKLAVSDAIYSKDFRHNLCGTSTLGKAGFSTLMHEGKVFLIEAKSMGKLPKTWKVRACEGVDRETGLPFIVMKKPPPKRAETVLKKETRKKGGGVTQIKQTNEFWRSSQEIPTRINLAKSYPERKVSRKGCAMGGGEFQARSRKPCEEEKLKKLINTVVEKARMSSKLQGCLGNSSGDGRTRLHVPPRFNC